MEEKPFKVHAKSLSPGDSVKASSKSDVRDLWTRATLSQPKLNMPLTNVYKDADQEDSPESSKAGPWYKQRTYSEPAWEERDDGKKVDIMKQRADGHTSARSPSSLPRNDGEGVEDSGAKQELAFSVSSFNTLKQTQHRAYLAEQQNRLPLPLMELMESEVLEILTKALQSYRSAIGKEHFLTRQLQGHIEGLKRRRNRRQHVLAH